MEDKEIEILQNEKTNEGIENLNTLGEAQLLEQRETKDAVKGLETPLEVIAMNTAPKEIQKIEILGAEILTIKGQKGEQGDKGETGERGEKGDTGQTGAGFTFQDLTESEKLEIKGEKGDVGIQGETGKDGFNGKDGKNGNNGKNGIDGKDGKNGKNGSPDTPENIAEKINTLSKAIEWKTIKNAPEIKGGGSGLNTVFTDGITITGNGFADNPLVAIGGGGGNITSINADTTAAQLLVTGTTGTDFAIVDNGTGTHTFNIPTASATNRGALSSADWTTFNNKGNGTVTSVSGTATRISSTGGATPVLDLVTTAVTPGSYTNTNLTVDAYGRITAASNGSGGGTGSGEATVFTVAQTAHGLSVGDIVRSNGTAGQFTKAQADSASNAEVIGIVTVVTDANNYTVTTEGYITTGVPTATAGTVFFLSATTAGLLTSTEPSTIGQVSIPLLTVITSASKAFFTVRRGLVVAPTGGGTVGPGTINELAYFDTTTSIASLTTATYPSLTELSYGKGVTSAIQTQLNGKQATLVSGTNIKTINGNSLLGSGDLTISGGGMAIGGSITSATAGSMLFAGASGVLAQDNANLFWDDTNNRLGILTNTPFAFSDVNIGGAYGSKLQLLAGAFGLQSASDDNGFVTINAYYDGAVRRIKDGSGGYIQFAGGSLYFGHFGGGTAGSSASITYSIFANPEGYVGIGNISPRAMLHVISTRSDLPVFIARGTTSQTGDLSQWQNNSATVLSRVKADGSTQPASMADSAATNDSIYYSTTASKLVYKDAGGTVNALY